MVTKPLDKPKPRSDFVMVTLLFYSIFRYLDSRPTTNNGKKNTHFTFLQKKENHLYIFCHIWEPNNPAIFFKKGIGPVPPIYFANGYGVYKDKQANISVTYFFKSNTTFFNRPTLV